MVVQSAESSPRCFHAVMTPVSTRSPALHSAIVENRLTRIATAGPRAFVSIELPSAAVMPAETSTMSVPIHIDAAKTWSGFTTREMLVVTSAPSMTTSVAMLATTQAAGLSRIVTAART